MREKSPSKFILRLREEEEGGRSADSEVGQGKYMKYKNYKQDIQKYWVGFFENNMNDCLTERRPVFSTSSIVDIETSSHARPSHREKNV